MQTVERKLIDLGGSLVVALPLSWVRERGLKAGDSVRVITGDLVVIDGSPSQETATK